MRIEKDGSNVAPANMIHPTTERGVFTPPLDRSLDRLPNFTNRGILLQVPDDGTKVTLGITQ